MIGYACATKHYSGGFDFDDTLTDDTTCQLLKRYNINEDDFWKKMEATGNP